MTEPAIWRKSTHSGPDAECVEVSLTAERALVRDTKNRGGDTLTVTFATWAAFVAGIKKDSESR